MSFLQQSGGCGTISPVKHTDRGAFCFISADGFTQSHIVGKAPRVTGLTSRRMLDTIGSSAGRFAFLAPRGMGKMLLGRKGYDVYVIESTSGHYKIGYSKNPMRRLKELQKTQGPFQYSFVSITSFETEKFAREAERYLHSLFVNHRVNGEWYKLDAFNLIYLGEQLSKLYDKGGLYSDLLGRKK